MPVIVNGSEIVLQGTVGELYWDECFTASDVIVALATVGHERDVTIRINSGGGIATEGSAIHSAISRHKGRKTIVVEGIAASAASVIAMAGDEVIMALGALMMVHDPSGLTFGTVKDHTLQIATLTAIAASMASVYADKSGKAVDACRADMEAELWMTAEEAVSQGYADRVQSRAQNDNEAEPTAFGYRAYTHAPERIVALADARAWSQRTKSLAALPAAPQRQQEISMPNDQAGTEPVVKPTAEAEKPIVSNVVDIDVARAEARAAGKAEALAYQREINEICALAGMSDKAQAFIEKDVQPAEARKELLEARASADGARKVSGHILPNAAEASAKKGALANSMKRMIGKGA